MDPREELTDKLLATGYISSCADYCQVARALQHHRHKSDILAMPELERWPDALAWLKARL